MKHVAHLATHTFHGRREEAKRGFMDPERMVANEMEAEREVSTNTGKPMRSGSHRGVISIRSVPPRNKKKEAKMRPES